MANDASTTGQIHEAGGVCSALDINIFRAWQRTLPGHKWTRAEVDRYDGLTLYDDSGAYCVGLHFAHSLCGYGGEGPHATVTILHEAGFGSRKMLEDLVFNRQSAQLRRLI